MDPRFNSICEAFEYEWRIGNPPDLTCFLHRVSDDDRSDLLRELISIELWWRRNESPAVAEQEYLNRFPNDASVVADAFEKRARQANGFVHGREVPKTDETIIQRQALDQCERQPFLCDEHGTPGRGTRIQYFGEYELISEIARGGMGVIFKARQIKLNRIVALKMLLSGTFARADEIQRFKIEAEAAANFAHPGIVPIFEIGEQQGQHYFSMGFVDGKNLSERIKDGPLRPREAAQITMMICDAVAFAHERGVIHRDLKPANVLIDSSGQPRVTDFGLAKRIQSDSGLTSTGAIMGTPSYMAPEQAAGRLQEVGPLSDVYSLGALLFALLTGRPPFQSATALDTLKLVLDQEPVRPRQLNPIIPADLETICLKAIRKSPTLRYRSVRHLQEDLRAFLDGQPIAARPAGIADQIRGWVRKNRTVSALVFGGTGGIIVTFLITHQFPATAAAIPGIAIVLPVFIVVGALVALLTWAVQNANEGPRLQQQLDSVLQDLEERLLRIVDKSVQGTLTGSDLVPTILPVFQRLRDRADISPATYQQTTEAIERLNRVQKHPDRRLVTDEVATIEGIKTPREVAPSSTEIELPPVQHWTKRRITVFLIAIWLLSPTTIFTFYTAIQSLNQKDSLRPDLIVVGLLSLFLICAVAIATPPVWYLRRRLRHFDARERSIAASALGRLGKKARSARSDLARCIEDPDRIVRVAAIRALSATFTSGEAVPPSLESASQSRDVVVASEAHQAIQRIRTPRTEEVLRTAWGIPTGVTLRIDATDANSKPVRSFQRLTRSFVRGAGIGAVSTCLFFLLFFENGIRIFAIFKISWWAVCISVGLIGGLLQLITDAFPSKQKREIKLFGMSDEKATAFLGAVGLLICVSVRITRPDAMMVDERLPVMFLASMIMLLNALIPKVNNR